MKYQACLGRESLEVHEEIAAGERVPVLEERLPEQGQFSCEELLRAAQK